MRIVNNFSESSECIKHQKKANDRNILGGLVWVRIFGFSSPYPEFLE